MLTYSQAVSLQNLSRYSHFRVSLFGRILILFFLKREENNNRKTREASCPFKNISLTETGENFLNLNRKAPCWNQKTYIFQKDRKKLHCYRALIKCNILLEAGPALKLYDVAQGLVQAGFEDLKVPRFHSILGDSILVLSYSLLFCSFLLEAIPAEKILILG